MAERSIAAVLKTVEGHTSGGSNPSLSAVSEKPNHESGWAFFISKNLSATSVASKFLDIKKKNARAFSFNLDHRRTRDQQS
jgi:hypothetical protein